MGVPMLVLHHKPLGLYPSPYNGFFYLEIRYIKQDGKLGKKNLVRPISLHDFLQNHQQYVWSQYGISLGKHRLVVPFQFVATGRKKLKYPNMIEEKQWNAL